MLLPILSFNAVNIDSFVVTPALLMYVAASGSNTPVLFAFRFVIF